MKKALLVVLLSLSLLSVGEPLVNPSYSKVIIQELSKEELNNKLIKAIENNDIKLVKNLISEGADVNAIVKEGEYDNVHTPLIFATQKRNKEIVELLISNGADVNFEYNKGFTPLIYACLNDIGSKDLIELLISKGADVNAVVKQGDFKGYTPLMFVFNNIIESKEKVELLISKGADVNVVAKEGDYKGFTPLLFATQKGNKEIVELLISKGSDVNVVAKEGDYKGFTPLLFASQNGNKETVELLISKGADVNAVVKQGDFKGYIPLMFAFQNQNKDTFNFLINKSDKNLLSYFEKNKNLVKNNITKENMHAIQILIQLYQSDLYSSYPEKLEDLEKYAKSNNYWTEINNPFTLTSGLGKNGSIMDYKTYKNNKNNSSFKGLVLYESINPKFNKEYKKTLCTKYKLYGTDENGELLKDKDGKVFFLSNDY
jgi:ankyrin repeat protein